MALNLGPCFSWVVLGCLATEHFHAHAGLNVPKPQLNPPPPRVEAGQVLRRIHLGIQQSSDQRHRLVLVAFGVVEQDAAGQAENAGHFQQRKPAAGLLGTSLRIGPLVLGRVGQTDGGAVDDFGVEAMPGLRGQRQPLFGVGGDRVADALERIQGKTLSGRAVAAGACLDRPQVVEAKQGLDLPDDFAARIAGVEDLIRLCAGSGPRSWRPLLPMDAQSARQNCERGAVRAAVSVVEGGDC